MDAANAQLKLTTLEFRRRFPNTLSTARGDGFSVELLEDSLVKAVRPSLLMFSIAVSLVLLIACANVANLLLVRAAGRRREIAIRVAVGAARGRIIRQLLTESVLLSSAAAVLGLGLGLAGIHALLALNPGGIPRLGVKGANVAMDWRVGLFTVVVALLTGILFGLIPALQAARTDVNSSLRENSGRSGIGFRQNKARSLLVISEVSLALLLLIGSALLIRTLIALRSVNPGFDPANVETTRTSIDPKLANTANADQLTQNVLRRVNALPGVEIAAYTRLLPLEGSFNSLPIVIVGRHLNGPSHGNSRWVVVSAGYFEALKIPLLRGRTFTQADRLGAPGVVIINQTLARKFWPEGDALGAQLIIGKGLGPNFEEGVRQVVGIAGDVHDDALNLDTQPAMFVPGAQIAEARWAGTSVAWVVRTRVQSQSLTAAIRNELRQATGVPVDPLRSMQEVLIDSTSRQDFNMLLMTIFGGSALLLAAIGVYGLMAYSVQQRAQEMGIRMALGARPGEVRNMVVFQGMRLTAVGVLLGAAAAFGLTRFIASLLFGVAVWDPVAFVLVPVVLAVVALAAVWLPAQRASRIDPAVALRCE
jgi:predicted permease